MSGLVGNFRRHVLLCCGSNLNDALKSTVKFLIFGTEQTLQTQIRLLLKEYSDHGLHCLPYCVHHLDTLLYGKTVLVNIWYGDPHG